ncbi:hypothetical protein QN382_19105 [Pseudomonas sp. 10B1]|uniref:hypothetical protein n=1 Tax=unclassified Pseudomonas TaxID=196821 RepID=UPI002B23A528|nr:MULTISPECIES: hypothetical protein [unclassified Pseudomonas]MEA9994301.1 hypothetical protein [Pseudomonas sp. AA4]MEB0088522.1 hypothetical protein [Pseudomonas sp. RTI1]MEB0126555.1 hypothetical protein [Pseudomonas sp. CCC1.2]MEB0154632.1 hypothetical protein [Pseudomonas sp. CCC4.3]MEB0221151.1 hypothetical protein [Pseudomonas sp. AB12(2023)]
MKRKYTKNELKALIVELSIDHHRAQLAVSRRRVELNGQYRHYFHVYGDPEPNHRGIRWDDPRYDGVIKYTNDAYDVLRKAKQSRYSAKRRLDIAIRRLMLLTNVSFAVPAGVPVKRQALTLVRRATLSGESVH